MITGETSSGFKYEIPEENLNNYELVEVLGELEENPLLISKTVTLLLGKEQREKLKDHLRTEGGTVPTDKISEEIMEIFNSQRETKNS
ncbi:hypothetical protein [Sporosarcina sp. 6E9]|uniref:hypothetical protein n=1 Tax=Sporosarcina sp. 6E9 TaxID=2819235 RepID=UPI001AD06F4E|nr:hypothetical protein [Sporosarcina sp. 6E9]MBO1909729.1 hypothetical protein [Microvirga sp. 3-52]